MANQQRIVRFSGNVQGVGFRYTACSVARRYGVTGYVRNLPDGDVECLLEGPAGEIDQFLTDLSEQLSGYILRQTSQTAPYSGKFPSFTVRF